MDETLDNDDASTESRNNPRRQRHRCRCGHEGGEKQSERFKALVSGLVLFAATVEEVDFSNDTVDLQKKLTAAERFLINRLVA